MTAAATKSYQKLLKAVNSYQKRQKRQKATKNDKKRQKSSESYQNRKETKKNEEYYILHLIIQLRTESKSPYITTLISLRSRFYFFEVSYVFFIFNSNFWLLFRSENFNDLHLVCDWKFFFGSNNLILSHFVSFCFILSSFCPHFISFCFHFSLLFLILWSSWKKTVNFLKNWKKIE